MVRTLVAPRKPGEVSSDAIMSTLKDHYDLKPSKLFCQSKFQRRYQRPGESIASAPKKIAADFNFGVLTTAAASAIRRVIDTTLADTSSNSTILPLDVMLRDRFVCGVQHDRLQQRHFAEQKLNFKQAYILPSYLREPCNSSRTETPQDRSPKHIWNYKPTVFLQHGSASATMLPLR